MELPRNNTNSKGLQIVVRAILALLFVIFAIMAGFFVHLLTASSLAGPAQQVLTWLFALDSTQVMWYITRAAGLAAYFLLWLSTAWGLAVSSKIFDQLLHRSFTYDFHQFLSLLAIGFLALHLVVLALDKYLPYTIPQILVPLLSPYRPVWVGIGVIAFYLTALVTVTFYLRNRIGMKTFRAIHVFSLVGYLGATIHGFFAGTDSSLLSAQLLYASTFLVVVFLTTYWYIGRLAKKPKPAPSAQQLSKS